MRLLGIGAVLIGFIWILADCGFTYTAEQHALWIWYSKRLPASELVPRLEATSVMRDVALDLLGRHRRLILPALIMLGGGVLLSLTGIARERDPRAAEPLGPANGG